MRRRMQALRLYVADFIMPGGVNRFGSTSGHMYTESIGYLLAFAIASVAFIMWGTLVPKALCSTNQTFTAADVQARKFVSANGIVSDFTLSHTGFGQRMRGFSGYDVSAVFPMLGELAADTRVLLPSRTQALLSKCVANESATLSFIESWRANSTLYYGGVDDFPTHCPFPQAPQTSGTDCLTASWEQFPSAKVGLLKISSSEVKEMHASPATSWVIIDDMVFDVSLYVRHASDELVVNGTRLADRQLRPENMFLPESLTKLFLDHPGKDISGAFHDLDIDDVLYKACMVQLFLRGTTQTAKSPFACANTNVVAWVTFGLYFVVLFARLVIAETYGWLRARKAVMASQSNDDDDDDDAALGSANNSPMDGSARQLEAGHADSKRPSAPKCIVVVPCFRESMETLSRTLQGVARSTHGGANTLLWIISDGDAAVLADILCIVAHAGRGSDAKFYGAYGATNASGYASARVFGGFYECGRHRIPYVVTAKDAYQGRVDTLMLVLNFFRNVAGSPRAAHGSLSPPRQTVFLEEEVEARMEALGHAPAAADYCLLLDARMQIDPLAITQFVARMEQSADVVALSGTVYPAGRAKSLLHVLQFFDLYLQHFVAPMCESLAGITCPLNQLFTMYRLRLPSGAPCLGDEGLTAAMAELMKRPVKWRHLAWPGNDCLLAPRLARQFPTYRWAFEPNARAEVELTKHQMVAFDPYQRQWFRSRLATLLDMLRGRIRKPAWPVVIAHLAFPFVVPAAACMLYLEIVISFFGDSPAIVVSELTGGFVGATLILLLARRKWSLAVYFLVYCVIAVPFYHVWIPTTAFFTMNRVWVPPEHADAQSCSTCRPVRPRRARKPRRDQAQVPASSELCHLREGRIAG
ncbi:hypothetical protein DL89DRAFT_111261 [Linderina pennispora]|uniref:chitin synthase n=1 Tax=Linderina pennispora TaxID=61395 RepID=A0A1Y1WFF3_9FUNG|nr:uncharacterized protein DL89DRAFT_111261 [Linderina pennispora]ORX72291.1 hypothetical protein DL89DRAFT_111261 [Linderina pennispora]